MRYPRLEVNTCRYVRCDLGLWTVPTVGSHYRGADLRLPLEGGTDGGGIEAARYRRVYAEDRQRAQSRRVVGHGDVPWVSSLWGENPQEASTSRVEAGLFFLAVAAAIFLPVAILIAAVNPGPVATPFMWGGIVLLVLTAVWLWYSWQKKRRSASSLDEVLRSRSQG